LAEPPIGAAEAALHRFIGNSETDGGFLDTGLLDRAQDEDDAELGGIRVESAFDRAANLTARGDRRRVCVGRVQLAAQPADRRIGGERIRQVADFDARPPPSLATMRAGQVHEAMAGIKINYTVK
jgi:hypothetical protein